MLLTPVAAASELDKTRFTPPPVETEKIAASATHSMRLTVFTKLCMARELRELKT